MPPPFDPEGAVIVFAVGGALAVGTWIAYKWADAQGTKLDLFPDPPPFPLLEQPAFLPRVEGRVPTPTRRLPSPNQVMAAFRRR